MAAKPGGHQSQQRVRQYTFATAAFTDHTDDLSPLHGKTDGMQQAYIA
ncbi:hypothetical protein JCM19237_1904 [Photobacterium aphoticum]|uniref:Uncharacterized protein n=1 Tax=Photobacterium aphoticum TaxID=754436 RepID=A0A090QWL5_9GAMM|nr:hypothetical protein JCM19237_1904 [Photobacterium aphoticum]